MATLAPPENELTRVQSYQWPAAHVGHLNDHQLSALDAFKALCQKKGYYTPATSTAPSSHDEETLLRYLRARKFVPADAFAQFKDTEDWRADNQLDTLYQTIDVQEYEQTRRLYPQWTGRRDKRGIPFYVYEIQHVDPKDVTAHSKDDKKNASPTKTPRKMLRLFALYENLCRFVLPFCSAIPNRPNGETPISQSSNVVDLSKVGFTKFWSLRSHMNDASALATAHYPETLDRIFVIGAPSFFPTVWQWAKKWFDPITVSKIFILSDKQVFPTLSQYVHPDNIPKKYGGNLDWHFGDPPFLEPAILDALKWNEAPTEARGGQKTLPFGPIKWQYDAKGDLVAMAVGTEHGKPRNRVVFQLHPQEGVARLALSPGRLSKEDTRPVGLAAAAAPAPTSSTSNTSTSATTNGAGAGAGGAAFDLPYRNPANGIASPPADSRQGTSHTRFAQQDATHAEGQLAHGTPEHVVDGRGEKVGVMEPNTVGQAPKEYPLPNGVGSGGVVSGGDGEGEVGGQKGYVEKAQEMVEGVLPASVLKVVGLGGEAEEKEEEKVRERDPAVEKMDAKVMEEFLRSKTAGH